MLRRTAISLVVIASILLTGWSLASAEEFPLRQKYPMVTPISTQELGEMYGKAVVVDTRNAAEHDVIRIAGAKLLIQGRATAAELEKIRGKNDSSPLVFYCNGITCPKSYKASKRAIEWGFRNVRCYDSGVFAWAKAFPERTEFFGERMTASEIEKALIPKAEFKSVQLAPTDFLARLNGGGYTLIDIRDPNERSEVKFQMKGLRVMSLDTVVRFITQKNSAVPRSSVLFVDNVGKQVRWLQYYLEREGMTDYFFLEGGVRNWYDKSPGPRG